MILGLSKGCRGAPFIILYTIYPSFDQFTFIKNLVIFAS